MSHKRLALHGATTLTQKLPTEFLEKLTAYNVEISGKQPSKTQLKYLIQ
jgi:hypothetical protein